MKFIEEQMAFYATYHGNSWNKLLANLFQIPVAPVFTELFFAIGLKEDVEDHTQKLSQRPK